MNAPIMPLRGVKRRVVLPTPIRSLVRKLPHVPSSAVVAAVLNLLVRKRLPVRVFEHLGERPFSIEVRDLGLVMAFRFSERRFVPVPHAGEEPLRFRVNASDFATLAAPDDAPDDGLFLHDLVVVGDPDIAGEVHEALGGIDVARTRRILRRAVRLARRECARG
jgi:O2-independent ubiquinone biosynthesis accessory factor UbiT